MSDPAGPSYGRNVVWNFLGLGLPALVALVAVPILVAKLGVDRLGVLTLAWAVIGYFGVFDLGLGRALTKAVAEKMATRSEGGLARVVWSSLAIVGALGILAGALVATLSPWLVGSVLNIPADLRDETLVAFLLLALSTPFVMVTAGLRGVLEATQRFDLVNAVRIPMGVATYAGPLLVLPFSHALPLVVGVLVALRVAGTLAYGAMCLRLLPELGGRSWREVNAAAVAPLLRTGAWMTVSNLVVPLMVTLDRFLIGALVTVAAVAYYATPYEVVTKLWIVPAAVTGVVFPAFASVYLRDRAAASALYARSLRFSALLLFPVVLAAIFFGAPLLQWWIDASFANESTAVLQWLAVGVFLSSVGSVAFGLVQAAGRSDWTAKLQLALLPAYIPALLLALRFGGIRGAAMAWSARMLVETALLFVLAQRLLRENDSRGEALLAGAMGIVLALAVPASVAAPPLVAGILVALAAAGCLWGAWLAFGALSSRAAPGEGSS